MSEDWEVQQGSGDAEQAFSIVAHGCEVARVCGSTFKRRQANARLIAAAPARLEALEEIAEMADKTAPGNVVYWLPKKQFAAAILAKAEAAIAEVEGETA